MFSGGSILFFLGGIWMWKTAGMQIYDRLSCKALPFIHLLVTHFHWANRQTEIPTPQSRSSWMPVILQTIFVLYSTSRILKYPTLGSGKSSSNIFKHALGGDMLVLRRNETTLYNLRWQLGHSDFLKWIWILNQRLICEVHQRTWQNFHAKPASSTSGKAWQHIVSLPFFEQASATDTYIFQISSLCIPIPNVSNI